MPMRNAPRLTMSSRREGCWACADAAASRNTAARLGRIRTIGYVSTATSGDTTRPQRLHLAAIFPDQTGSRTSAGHFALQLLKSTPRLALALVDKPDRGIPGHGAADDGRRVLADRLVHIIVAIILASGRPLDCDPRHRGGPDLVIAIGLDQLDSNWLFLDHSLFRLGTNFRLIADAGNGRERMIGRVALTQNVSLQIFRISVSKHDAIGLKCVPRPGTRSFPRPRM